MLDYLSAVIFNIVGIEFIPDTHSNCCSRSLPWRYLNMSLCSTSYWHDLSATNDHDTANEVSYYSSYYFESGMNRRSNDSGSVLLLACCVGISGAGFRIQQVLRTHSIQIKMMAP
jgi:hypothetical protein